MKGDYLTGDSITIADISIACSLTMPTILYADILAKFDKGPVNDNSRDFSVKSSRSADSWYIILNVYHTWYLSVTVTKVKAFAERMSQIEGWEKITEPFLAWKASVNQKKEE